MFEILHKSTRQVLLRLDAETLAGAELARADLRGADLRGADLRGARLPGAQLGEARLEDANLADADLRGADLTGADLRASILARANLTGANLEDAELRGAILSKAVYDISTRWPGITRKRLPREWRFRPEQPNWYDGPVGEDCLSPAPPARLNGGDGITDRIFRQRIPLALMRQPGIGRRARIVVRFELTGALHQVWTLDLRDETPPPRVLPGAGGIPDLTVRVSRDHFVDLVEAADPRRWLAAYTLGQVQVRGNALSLHAARRLWIACFPELPLPE